MGVLFIQCSLSVERSPGGLVVQPFLLECGRSGIPIPAETCRLLENGGLMGAFARGQF